jgi:ParB family chromosome partitioning protein
MKLDDAKVRIPTAGIHRKRDSSAIHSRFSLYSATNKEDLSYVDIEKIIPFKNQARRHFDEETIESLSNSIKEHGIRSPLTLLRSGEEGFFEVVSGERRLRAAKLAGLKKIPAFIIENAEKAEQLALIENVQREDLHPIELGQACKTLLDQKLCFSTQEIAENIGVSKSKIVESISLLSLPTLIQDYIVNNKIINRDLFRRLKKAKGIQECEEILGIRQTTFPSLPSSSLLRVYMEDGVMRVQKGKIKLLSDDERASLYEKLKEILEEVI